VAASQEVMRLAAIAWVMLVLGPRFENNDSSELEIERMSERTYCILQALLLSLRERQFQRAILL
jgi:hypothetical protein